MEHTERTEDQIGRWLRQIREGNPVTLFIDLFDAGVTVYWDPTVKKFRVDTAAGKKEVDRDVLVRAMRLFIEEQKGKQG